MKEIDIRCPPDAWPKTFSGSIAIGIVKARASEPSNLWLLFTVKLGVIETIGGILATTESGVPEEVSRVSPVIIASAARSMWELAIKDKASFYSNIKDGLLTINGDFRIFGRYTPSLVRLAEGTDLWDRFDSVLEILMASP